MEKVLERIIKEVKKELNTMKISVDYNSKIVVSNKLTRSYGRARKLVDGHQITLSSALFKDLDKLKNTLIHEYLHTCKDCMNHGSEWKYYASMMNNQFGYKISRVTPISEVNEDMQMEIISTKNYCVYCPVCGNEYYYKNKTKAVKNPRLYRCSCKHVGLKSKEI